MTMSHADFIAIHQLVALYGHILDEQRYDRAEELFTDDARYDTRPMGGPLVMGCSEIIALWNNPSTAHPVAHLATNLLFLEAGTDRIAIRFKGLGVGARGRVGAVVYDAELIRAKSGWRFRAMIAKPSKINQASAD